MIQTVFVAISRLSMPLIIVTIQLSISKIERNDVMKESLIDSPVNDVSLGLCHETAVSAKRLMRKIKSAVSPRSVLWC